MVTPYPHQEKFAELVWQQLKTTGYAYLAGKPRSGKTLTSILAAEKSDKIKYVLVLTKKNAIPGWSKFIEGRKHEYTVTNYEQVHKLPTDHFDLVIIDESHNIGAFPKPSKRVIAIKKLCQNLPHIHLSGTAIVESPMSIYHQMFISKYNPFTAFKNFYRFHETFGIKYYVKAAGRDITQYDRHKPELIDEINKFTIYMTQEDAGIDKSVQAVDKIHYVELQPCTRSLYNELQEHQIAKVANRMFTEYMPQDLDILDLVCDSTMKLRTSLHMLESGIAKVDDTYIELGNTEKIDYIMKEFGDHEDIGIMCHFVGERNVLERKFRRAKIYSSNAHAEGVDLSHLRHFIILSSDYSGAKFIQRRDRIVNVNGSNTLVVNHILVKKAISDQVYKRVSKKEDFNNKTYEMNDL